MMDWCDCKLVTIIIVSFVQKSKAHALTDEL